MSVVLVGAHLYKGCLFNEDQAFYFSSHCLVVEIGLPLSLLPTGMALQAGLSCVSRINEKGLCRAFPYQSTQAPKMPVKATESQFWTCGRQNDWIACLNQRKLLLQQACQDQHCFLHACTPARRTPAGPVSNGEGKPIHVLCFWHVCTLVCSHACTLIPTNQKKIPFKKTAVYALCNNSVTYVAYQLTNLNTLQTGVGEIYPIGTPGSRNKYTVTLKIHSAILSGSRSYFLLFCFLVVCDFCERKVIRLVKIHVINAGVDTLVLNASYVGSDGKPEKRELPPDFADTLDAWKKQAQMQSEPLPVDLVFNQANLLMQPNGAGRGQWQWMLKTPDITLYISRGKWNSLASVRLNSEFLWSCPFLTDAIVRVHSLLYDVFNHSQLHLQPSSIDLCADIAGWNEAEYLDKKRDFVSHSRDRGRYSEADDFSSGLRETGYDFSARGPMSITIYDKTREVRKKGKTWFLPLWELHDWNEKEESQVWRIEAKFKREALRDLLWQGQHGIEDAYQLEELLPLLWAYAVGHASGGSDGLPDGWLRCVTPTSDSNRARWPTCPAWQVVQGAFSQGLEIPPHFGQIIRKAKEDHNVEKGLAALLGYASSLSAWCGGDLAEDGVDLSVFLHWLLENGLDYLEKKDRDFAAEVLKKQVKFGKRVLEPSDLETVV